MPKAKKEEEKDVQKEIDDLLGELINDNPESLEADEADQEPEEPEEEGLLDEAAEEDEDSEETLVHEIPAAPSEGDPWVKVYLRPNGTDVEFQGWEYFNEKNLRRAMKAIRKQRLILRRQVLRDSRREE